MILLDVRNVGVRFALRRRQRAGFKGLVMTKLLGRTGSEQFWALSGVTMSVRQGECLGVIGRNGSGKTTLSRVISGIYPPDEGEVAIHGRVTVLSLGAGFVRDLPGRQNIAIQCALMGMTRREAADVMPKIVEFGDLGSFIDQPVRLYSSGMQSRLAFSIAVHVTPDILVVDEVLSVGDEAFRNKATEKMHGMMSKARAVVVITHSLEFVRKHCTRTIWLKDGRVAADGDSDAVASEYYQYCQQFTRPSPPPAQLQPQPSGDGP